MFRHTRRFCQAPFTGANPGVVAHQPAEPGGRASEVALDRASRRGAPREVPEKRVRRRERGPERGQCVVPNGLHKALLAPTFDGAVV